MLKLKVFECCGTRGPCLCVLGATYEHQILEQVKTLWKSGSNSLEHWYYFIFGNAIVTFLPSYSAACLQSSVFTGGGLLPASHTLLLPVCRCSFTETSQTAADTKGLHLLAYFHSNFPSFSSPRCPGVTRLDGLFSSWLLLFQVKRTFEISVCLVDVNGRTRRKSGVSAYLLKWKGSIFTNMKVALCGLSFCWCPALPHMYIYSFMVIKVSSGHWREVSQKWPHLNTFNQLFIVNCQNSDVLLLGRIHFSPNK